MNVLFQAASDLQKYCFGRKWSMCFIGGIAVQRWGEPRFTKDADVTLLTGFGTEDSFVDALLANYKARIPNAR